MQGRGDLHDHALLGSSQCHLLCLWSIFSSGVTFSRHRRIEIRASFGKSLSSSSNIQVSVTGAVSILLGSSASSACIMTSDGLAIECNFTMSQKDLPSSSPVRKLFPKDSPRASSPSTPRPTSSMRRSLSTPKLNQSSPRVLSPSKLGEVSRLSRDSGRKQATSRDTVDSSKLVERCVRDLDLLSTLRDVTVHDLAKLRRATKFLERVSD